MTDYPGLLLVCPFRALVVVKKTNSCFEHKSCPKIFMIHCFKAVNTPKLIDKEDIFRNIFLLFNSLPVILQFTQIPVNAV